MSRPDISIIVVSYNTRAMTLNCLAALDAALEGDGVAAEIFVVDNGSADGSAAAVRGAFPGVRVIENARNAGFGAANNQAMRSAGGEFVLLLNSDAFVRPGAIGAMVRCLRDHPEAGAVGPRLLNGDGSLQRSCYKFPGPGRAAAEGLLLTAAFPNHRRLGDYRAWDHAGGREVGFVIGACLLLRRAALDEVGMFDEDFFLYAEETDLCYRLRRAGWAVRFTPEAEVVHLNGGSGKAQPDRVFEEFQRGQERFVRKHHGRAGLAVYRAMRVVGSAVRVAAFGAAGRWAEVRRWRRILRWTLGSRGPGLSDLQRDAA